MHAFLWSIQYLAVSNHGFLVTAHPEAFLNATVIILYVVFWIVLLNLSFAYRNAVGLLMSPSTITGNRMEPFFRLPLVRKRKRCH
jgi:preprotein translocase subunit SecG